MNRSATFTAVQLALDFVAILTEEENPAPG